MKKNITETGPYRWWIYLGPGVGYGEVHKVLVNDPAEVITWSLSVGSVAEGWSWMGSMVDFKKHFKPFSP